MGLAFKFWALVRRGRRSPSLSGLWDSFFSTFQGFGLGFRVSGLGILRFRV